jgi:hypothetical protein
MGLLWRIFLPQVAIFFVWQCERSCEDLFFVLAADAASQSLTRSYWSDASLASP